MAMAITARFLLLLTIAVLAILLAESGSMVSPEAEIIAFDQYTLNEIKHGQGSLKSYQCPGQCNRRCSQTQYKKPCLFFCNQCCSKCLCVPPGYYGNKWVCPCYNNWKTKRGGPKCP